MQVRLNSEFNHFSYSKIRTIDSAFTTTTLNNMNFLIKTHYKQRERRLKSRNTMHIKTTQMSITDYKNVISIPMNITQTTKQTKIPKTIARTQQVKQYDLYLCKN